MPPTPDEQQLLDVLLTAPRRKNEGLGTAAAPERTSHRHRGPRGSGLTGPAMFLSDPRTRPEVSPAGADLLRVISDPRTPVFVTVHANGRRRYGYWQPFDSATGRGGCYVALSTDECDKLQTSGRVTLGEPIVDPSKTIYRVLPARTPAAPERTAREWARAA
ncbi:cell envelope biogenesis protein OmpA [Streptomyces sp. NPDC003697]